MAIIYTFDETFDGLLTCVFYAYKNKRFPNRVISKNNLQGDFLSEYIEIKTEKEAAERVKRGLYKAAPRACYLAYTAFMSDINEIFSAVFNFIVLALTHKSAVFNMLQNENVLLTEKGSYRTTHEADKLKGFLRFQETEGKIMYAEIEPSCNVLEILAQHFADRFVDVPFVIRDTRRAVSAISCKGITLTTLPLESVPKMSENEEEYQRLWKQFVKSVNIKERKNPKCRQTLMPKKYWKNMLETKPDLNEV